MNGSIRFQVVGIGVYLLTIWLVFGFRVSFFFEEEEES
jgi:hypothetical protein